MYVSELYSCISPLYFWIEDDKKVICTTAHRSNQFSARAALCYNYNMWNLTSQNGKSFEWKGFAKQLLMRRLFSTASFSVEGLLPADTSSLTSGTGQGKSILSSTNRLCIDRTNNAYAIVRVLPHTCLWEKDRSDSRTTSSSPSRIFHNLPNLHYCDFCNSRKIGRNHMQRNDFAESIS